MSISSLAALPPLSAVVLVAIGAFIGWNSVAGIRSGSVSVRGGTFSRRKNPRSFWFSVTIGFAFSSTALFLGPFNLVRLVASK